MKKRKIVSFFTAIAIAVACIIVPPADKGLDVVAAADSVVTDGGITLTKVGAADISATDNTLLNTLKKDDTVQLNITIPELNYNLNGLQVRVYYNKDVFSVVRWYADSEHQDWPYAGDTLTGFIGFVGTENNRNDGVLAVASANTNPNITALNSSSQTLKAILRVNNLTAETDFKFFVILEDDFVDTVSSSGDVIKKAHDTFEDDGEGYTFFSYHDEATDTDSIIKWNPTDNLKVISGKISRTITAQLKDGDEGIDFDYYQSDFEAHPLKVSVYKASSGYSELVDELYWLSDSELEDYLTKIDELDVNEDGSFVLTGLENGSYYLKLNCWGKFAVTKGTSTVLKNYYPLEITSSMAFTYTIPTDIKFWMFGDVDHKGTIGATDATAILKFIVGKTSAITSSTCNQYTIGNVYGTDNLNVRDATQILRKSAKLSSVFDTKPPYTT